MQQRKNTPLQIHFMYLGNKEMYHIFETHCIIRLILHKMPFTS
jgi:hypothetical protein